MRKLQLPSLLLAALLPLAWSAHRAVAASTVTSVGPTALTYHYDNLRSGVNAQELTLTLANVNYQHFGKVATYTLDGEVHAEPLYVDLSASPKNHHWLFAATENDSVYSINTDNGAQLWKTSLLASDETPAPGTHVYQTTKLGVMGTPVISLSAGPNGVIYVVGASVDAAGNYHERLHALDLITGAELFGGPTEITATYPGTGDNSSGGIVTFDPKQYIQRTGLLLVNNTIYITWSSKSDSRPYTGWIMAYSASTLQQTSVLNITPNGHEGGIWMSGGAPAADSNGNVYFVDGNGTFDTTFTKTNNPSLGDYGNALIKISTTAGKMAVADYYAPDNTYNESAADLDYGSSGVLLLPPLKDQAGKVWYLAASSSKVGNVYLNNVFSLGKYHAKGGTIYQELDGLVPNGNYNTPLYFNSTLYFGSKNSGIMAFNVEDAKITTASPTSTTTYFGYPGPIPVISANGTQNGILWALDQGTPELLHAYNAANLGQELYNSSQAPNGRDTLGAPFHFSTPTVIAGRVYVGTLTGIAVYGLLP